MSFDDSLFLALNQALSGPTSTLFFSIITRLGDGLVLALIVLPLFYFYDRVRFKKHALAMVLSVALSGLVVNLMKVAVDRPRPPEHFASLQEKVHAPLGLPRDRSFPSGHTQTGFGTAVYLSSLYPSLSPVFIVLAALVGLSRVAIGVHFPLDVLVGAVIGTIFSVLGFQVANKRNNKIAKK